MVRASRMVGVILAFGIAVQAGQAARAQGGLTAVWLGQIGEDRVGPSGKPGPSGVQDLVFELRNLPPGRAIETVRVTGKGGDEWNVKSRQGTWAAALELGTGGTARVFVEPFRKEDGREFQLQIVFEGGAKTEIYLRGGKADPDLRTAAAALRAVWIGQDGSDRTGPTAAVGPDGWKDVRIGLERLSAGVEVVEVNVRDGKRRAWSAGKNPTKARNAEFLRDAKDGTKGDLYFDPAGPLKAGELIAIQLVYANGKKDRADVRCETAVGPSRKVVPDIPKVEAVELDAKWKVARKGGGMAAEVALRGVEGKGVRAVVLTDSWMRVWVWRRDQDLKLAATDWAGELAWDGATSTLGFQGTEFREGTRFSVRLVRDDGMNWIGEFLAPALDSTPPAQSLAAEVTSEEELRRLAGEGGRRLSVRGRIRLREPLVMGEGTALEGLEGSTLEFDQPTGAQPWAEAISLGGGWSKLSGLAVRFGGPVRWDRKVSYGPAIFGLRGGAKGLSKVELVGLDIQGPPSQGDWEEAPHTTRFMEGASGRIVGCKIQAGMIEVRGGPWEIAGNVFRGPRAGTYANAVIGAHHSRSLVISDNTTSQDDVGGKAWRFLTQPRWGLDTVVRGNKISGIGPRDDDERPHPNAPEVILTEGYRTSYEGIVAAVGGGGRLLAIHEPQGEGVQPGYVVAVVSGKGAGQWARVDQVIGTRTFWLDRAVAAEGEAVVIGEGFVGQSYEGNTIDCGGSTQALPFVLAGSHYGTRVARNLMIGGRRAIRLTAFPTELPVHWGWSTCPTFDARVEENRVEDPSAGGYLGVERTASSKSTAGRTYFTASLVGNTVAWSKPGERIAWVIGDAAIGEPAEARIEMRGSKVEAPAGEILGPSLRIECGTVNGQPYHGAAFELNREPAGASPK